MENTTQKNDKNIYCSPVIERVTLDNEISLALESYPPAPETKNDLNTSEYFTNDPFKTDVG